MFYLFIAVNQKKNVINEVIEEEDEEKNNKINDNKENIENNNNGNNNYINIVDIKNYENNDINNYVKKIDRKIKYIPYNKNTIKKHNSESLIQIKKNDYKQLLSSEENNDKNISNNFKYNDRNNNNTKNIILNNNNNSNSSGKNLFSNKIKLSTFKNNLKETKDKRNEFIQRKLYNLSNIQTNSNENIFNKKLYKKNLSLREKIIKDKNIKESATLPELNSNNYKNNILKKINNNINENNNANNNFKKISIFKSKTTFDEKMKYFRTKSVSSEKIKINNDININNNIMNYSPSTSAYTNSTKQINSNKSNSKNATDDFSKYRLGLLSAGSSSYNNVIIPMLSLRRPVSNFNFGGDKLWNNGDSNSNNINIKNEIKEENKPMEKEDSVIFRNKNTINVFKNKYTIKSQKYKDRLCDSENNDDLLYRNMEKLIPKFHKIKIEKGMMNTNIANTLGKKLFINYYNQHNKNNKLPISFKNDRKNNIYNNNNMQDNNIISN